MAARAAPAVASAAAAAAPAATARAGPAARAAWPAPSVARVAAARAAAAPVAAALPAAAPAAASVLRGAAVRGGTAGSGGSRRVRRHRWHGAVRARQRRNRRHRRHRRQRRDAVATGGMPAPGASRRRSPGQIVITELMHDVDRVSDDHGEWFEVYNPSTHRHLRSDGVRGQRRRAATLEVSLTMRRWSFRPWRVSRRWRSHAGSSGFDARLRLRLPDQVRQSRGADQADDPLRRRHDRHLRLRLRRCRPTGANIGGHTFSVDPDH